MSVDVQALRQKQANGLVVGVVPTSGPPALRLEIDDFIQDTELANLYFLAMEAFMSTEVAKDPFSYYEIGGIHGQPQRAWDNVTSVNFGKTKPSPSTERAPGYCSHGSVLFPTWHRAYVAQFEQALFLHAADIAKALGVEPVLDRFRVPYWDYFLPRQRSGDGQTYTYGVPLILTLPEILVRRPETPTQWTPMKNPLYKFTFPTDRKKPGIAWNTYSDNPKVNREVSVNTIRGYDGSTPRANHSYVIQTFDSTFNPVINASRGSDEAERLWRVMFDNKSFASVSNHTALEGRLGPNPPDPNLNSIEGFHDDIHGYLGKGPNSDDTTPFGHMALVEFAGFDPTFFLHHCNIDRVFAIWQGIHSQDPESQQWWTSLDNRDGNFVEPAGVVETPTTPLAPFRKAVNGSTVTWWTSNDVRNTSVLGYDYPQIVEARRTGDIVKGLRAWANAELGWANPNAVGTQGGDPNALKDFVEKQIPASIPFFPPQIKLDGVTELPSGTDYISSESRSKAQPESKVKLTAAKFEQNLVDGELAQHVLDKALPQTDLASAGVPGNLEYLVSKDRKMTQWNASFSVEKYCLNGPFMIHFFLGDFSSAPDAVWLHAPTRAGTSSIFASTDATIATGACPSCEQKSANNFKYYDTVGLTHALTNQISAGGAMHDLTLADLEPEHVVPFLTRNLHWRVVNYKGQDVPRETIPSLKVVVYSETVTLPEQLSDTPRFEEKRVHYGVTAGRPGGLSEGEWL